MSLFSQSVPQKVRWTSGLAGSRAKHRYGLATMTDCFWVCLPVATFVATAKALLPSSKVVVRRLVVTWMLPPYVPGAAVVVYDPPSRLPLLTVGELRR